MKSANPSITWKASTCSFENEGSYPAHLIETGFHLTRLNIDIRIPVHDFLEHVFYQLAIRFDLLLAVSSTIQVLITNSRPAIWLKRRKWRHAPSPLHTNLQTKAHKMRSVILARHHSRFLSWFLLKHQPVEDVWIGEICKDGVDLQSEALVRPICMLLHITFSILCSLQYPEMFLSQWTFCKIYPEVWSSQSLNLKNKPPLSSCCWEFGYH